MCWWISFCSVPSYDKFRFLQDWRWNKAVLERRYWLMKWLQICTLELASLSSNTNRDYACCHLSLDRILRCKFSVLTRKSVSVSRYNHWIEMPLLCFILISIARGLLWENWTLLFILSLSSPERIWILLIMLSLSNPEKAKNFLIMISLSSPEDLDSLDYAILMGPEKTWILIKSRENLDPYQA